MDQRALDRRDSRPVGAERRAGNRGHLSRLYPGQIAPAAKTEGVGAIIGIDSYLPAIGGVQLHIARLVPKLVERGHRVTIVVGSVPEGAPGVEAGEGFEIHRIPIAEAFARRDPVGIAEVRAELARVWAAAGPQVAHLNLMAGTGLLFADRLRRTDAGLLLYLPAIPPPVPEGKGGLIGQLFARASSVVAPSQAVADGVSPGAAACGVQVIHHGLDLPSAAPPPLPFDPPVVMGVGRLIASKGFADLVRAMLVVRERIPGARLVIAGDGPERESLVDMAAGLGLGGSVEFPGWLAPDAVAGFFDQGTVGVIPTLGPEGFGMVSLQAQARGRPVVASRCGGPQEVIEEGVTGVSVDAGDPAALALAIGELLTDRERAVRMGQAAAERVRRNFSLDREADSYDRIYRILPGRR